MFRYLRIEILRMFRDRRFVFFTMAIPVAFYLLWASIFKTAEKDPATGLSLQVYLMVSMATFGAIGAALTTTGPRLAAERKSGWLRQLQTTPLPAWTVITVKILASMILALPAILLVSLVAVATQGVRLSALEWIGMIALMWISTLPFAALGTLIGTTVGPDAAQPVTLGCYFTFSIVGGLWVPVSQLPMTLRNIARWTPSDRFNEIGQDIVGGHTPSATAGLVLVAWTLVLGALAITTYRRTIASS